MQHCDTLIAPRWCIPVEPAGVVLEDHAIAIADGRIVGVLPLAEAPEKFQPTVTVERPGHAVIPGLVNAHTHAAMTLFRGLAEGIAQGRSVRGYPEWFFILGQRDFDFFGLASVPNQLFLVVISITVIGAALAFTPFGRSLYAIGNNETGARFSGMPVMRNKFAIYTLSGFMSGLAGWVFVSRVSTTRQDMGTGWELTAITAVVVGGTSIFGGSGTIIGTVLGLALIQLMKNGLALSGAKGDSTTIVVGLVLIGAVLLNTLIANPPQRIKQLLPGRS